jgi:hypothetical protein
MGDPMDASIASKSAPLSDKSTDAGTLRLNRRASLMVILALSLGLWAAIMAAVASLATVVAG